MRRSTVQRPAPRVAPTASYRVPTVRRAPSRLSTRNGSATKVWESTTAVVEKAMSTPRALRLPPSSPRRPNV